MKLEEILYRIIPEEYSDYHCFDMLKKILSENEEFRIKIETGIKEEKIKGFEKELWESLGNQNIRIKGINNCLDIFKNGWNEGRCTTMSTQVSYSMSYCNICGGILPILIGTTNSPDGSHTWIEKDGKIYDTTLMLVIDKKYAKEIIGYLEEKRNNPNLSPMYIAAKEYTNDPHLKRKNSRK